MADENTDGIKPADQAGAGSEPKDNNEPALGFMKALGVEVALEDDPAAKLDADAEGDETESGAALEGDDSGDADGGDADGTPEPKPEDEQPRPKLKRRAKSDNPAISKDDIIAAVKEAVKPPAKTEEPLKKADEPEEFADLAPQDRDVLKLAKWAEENANEKGLVSQHLSWIKARDRVVARMTADGERFDPSSEAWRDFLAENPPPINADKRIEIKTEMAATAAERRAEGRMRKEIEEREKKLRREVNEMKLRPHIEKAAKETVDYILEDDDDTFKAVKADPKKAVEENPMEAPKILAVANDIKRVTEEFLAVANELKDYDDDDPAHRWVATFVEDQGKKLDALPVEKRMRNGKVLVSRQTYYEMSEAKSPDLSKVETLSRQDIITLLQDFGKNEAKRQVTEVRQSLERSGYSRKLPAANTDAGGEALAAAAVKQAAPRPVARQAPKATTTRIPSPPAKPAGSMNAADKARLKALGVNV
jgi:hypothetical protein